MSLKQIIGDFSRRKERLRSSEVAACIVEFVLAQLAVDRPTYESADESRQVVWRGAVTWAKDLLKRPEPIEEMVNGQEEMDFGPSYSEFVWIGEDDDGNIFARRRSLTQKEYEAMLGLLEKKRDQLAAKLRRYRADYETALPHWGRGASFGEAMQIAAGAIID